MKILPILKPGDSVELIAPASRCSEQRIKDIITLLISWQLKPIIAKDIFAKDILCANSDENRFRFLKNALLNPLTKAIFITSGGYGCNRLLPELTKIKSPKINKIFVGMSDSIALQIFLQQHWQWPTIHSAPAQDKFSPDSIVSLKEILFAKKPCIEFIDLQPLNNIAHKNRHIEATITGGNLTLIQTTMGTPWQIDTNQKILFLEEIGERGYRIDRILQHLKQANIFNNVAAMLLGDFISGDEPNGTSLIEPVLKQFADSCDFPVVKINGIGHGHTNFALPFGTPSKLILGNNINLICQR